MPQLIVNGHLLDVSASADTPLLWVLRDNLGLMGTRYGCGAGLCGACTVHLDGNAVRSCVTPLSAVGKGRVTTIEGLTDNRSPVGKALRSAWALHNVPQCGYCQSGQIMQAAALLARNRRPNTKQIEQAMDGNLCRCGTYARIRAAIGSAAGELAAQPAGKRS